MNVSFLFVGVIFDKFGTLVTRIVCILAITIGLLLLAFVDMSDYLVFPGIMLFSAGSFSLSLTNLPLAQVLVETKTVILTTAQDLFCLDDIISTRKKLYPKVQALIMSLTYAMFFLSTSTYR